MKKFELNFEREGEGIDPINIPLPITYPLAPLHRVATFVATRSPPNEINLSFSLPELKRKTVEFSLFAYKKIKKNEFTNLFSEGIDDLGFKNMFSQEKQLQSLLFCSQNNIELKEPSIADDDKEIEEDPISNADIEELDEGNHADSEEPNQADEAYVPITSVQIAQNIVSRRKTRSSDRSKMSMQSREDQNLAQQLQEQELQVLELS